MVTKPTPKDFIKFWQLPRPLSWAVTAIVVGSCLLLLALLVFIIGRTIVPLVNNFNNAPIAVVVITPEGFVPSTLAINHGTKVVWVNQDTLPHRVAADPYPTHKELPRLFAPKALGKAQTYSFTFTKTRTVHYHDELNPTAVWEGVITVK